MRKQFLLSYLLGLFLIISAVFIPARPRFVLVEALANTFDVPLFWYNLAECYYKGRGTPTDLTLARQWYEKAAQQNYAKALYKLGNLFSHRCGIQKGTETSPDFWKDIPLDYKKAAEYYSGAASQIASACLRLGFFEIEGLLHNKNYTESLKWYHKAANKNSRKAMWWLGYLYSHGIGFSLDPYEQKPQCWREIKRNYKKALKWYTRAANKGDITAQYMSGYFYSQGTPTLSNPKSVNFFRKTELEGVPLDYAQAARWYTLAAERGHIFACCELAHLFYFGCGVEQNYETAFKWYMKAASEGNPLAQRWAGCCYEEGKGVGQSFEKAKEYYIRASKSNDCIADYYLQELSNKTNKAFN